MSAVNVFRHGARQTASPLWNGSARRSRAPRTVRGRLRAPFVFVSPERLGRKSGRD